MNGLTGTVANLYNALEPDIKITPAQGKYFLENKDVLLKIKAISGVEEVSGTLSDKALIKNFDRQTLVSVKGVDGSFNRVTRVDSSITEGKFDFGKKGGRGILLGRGIANQLQVSLNDFASELVIYSPIKGKAESLNPQENVNEAYFTPRGIFSLNDEFDFQYAFIDIETARELFDSPGKLSALELKCAKGKTGEVQEELINLLGDGFIVKNRYQLNDVLFKSLETEKLATFIILAFILIIATFNIIGALTMLIIEKKKDIRTLYSMGADMGLLRNIFMREGFMITAIGAGAGLLLGLVVCLLQMQFHFVKFGNDFIIPYYPVELQLRDFVWILGLIMLIGFLAALYPVRLFTRADMVHEGKVV